MHFAHVFIVCFAIFVKMSVYPQTVKSGGQQTADRHEEVQALKEDADTTSTENSTSTLEQDTNTTSTENSISRRIKNLLKGIKNVRDPISETNLRFDIPSNMYMNGKLEMVVVFLFGQANATLETFSYDESNGGLRFTLAWGGPVIFMTTNNHQVTLSNSTNEIVERSQIRIVLSGLRVEGSAVVENKKISQLNLIPSVSKSLFSVHGLLNDPEVSIRLTNGLTKHFPGFLNSTGEIVSRFISPYVQTALNENL
ncbi:hypothetical protein NQ318_019838 [Aromia moschata]|uniref:Uncharacterized protein n=1 Tax=Aromia moschata TaxID=1265417 RepID=A0AAV8YMK2_9CUCU|nr:hypothetical protein NQ318_019838 [Aromia moschata]